MSQPLQAQIEQLEKTIAGLEAQRTSLGEAVVETALAPLQLRLDELQRQRQDPEIQTKQAPEEQRKLVSVLCADLAGFTALSTTLDPEELREIQQAYFAAVTPPIHKRGGVVEKYIGDAVLAVFGLPQAHEDDPERAVRAALEMQSALEELNSQRVGETGFPLHMRVGVSTGTVLATLHPETGEFVVTGETVNLASRIQNLAPPGGVLIPYDTYRHLRGVFDVLAMEPVQVKGLPEPLAVYQVVRAKPRAFRPVVRGVEGIETPLVGRQSELKFLQDALLGAIEEHDGQVVTVCGEAGVGKSRLLYEFQNWFELLPDKCVCSRARLGRRRRVCRMPCCATCSPSASRSWTTILQTRCGKSWKLALRRSLEIREEGNDTLPLPGAAAGIRLQPQPAPGEGDRRCRAAAQPRADVPGGILQSPV